MCWGLAPSLHTPRPHQSPQAKVLPQRSFAMVYPLPKALRIVQVDALQPLVLHTPPKDASRVDAYILPMCAPWGRVWGRRWSPAAASRGASPGEGTTGADMGPLGTEVEGRATPPPPKGLAICLCHGGICELSIRCSWPKRWLPTAPAGRMGMTGVAGPADLWPMGQYESAGHAPGIIS